MRVAVMFGALATLVAGVACSLLVPIDDDVTGGGRSGDGSSEGSSSSSSGEGGSPTDGAADGDAANVVTEKCPSTDPSLVAWFRFDEDGGTTANDCSQKGLTATSIGPTSPKWTAGRVGNAIDLDGTGTCLEVNTNALAFEGAPFTVAAWVFARQYATPTNLGRWVASHKVSNNGWHVGTDDPDRIELDVEFGDGGKQQTGSAISAFAWTHIAATYAPGTKTTAWVNGVQVASREINVPSSFGAALTATFRIGCRSATQSNFDGLIDDLRVYDRVLDAAEISALAAK